MQDNESFEQYLLDNDLTEMEFQQSVVDFYKEFLIAEELIKENDTLIDKSKIEEKYKELENNYKITREWIEEKYGADYVYMLVQDDYIKEIINNQFKYNRILFHT